MSKRKRGRPSAEEELNRSEILEVAIQVFAEKGFDGTQSTEIARRVGINKSLLNYHFGNKEKLWKLAVERIASKFTQRLTEIKSYFRDLEGIALMKAYNRQFIYFSAEHPEFYKIVFHEMCAQSERSKWLIETILKPMHEFFEKLIITEDNKTLLEGIPLANFSSILIGAANVFFIHAFQMQEQYGIDPFDEKEIEKHADIVNDLMFSQFSHIKRKYDE